MPADVSLRIDASNRGALSALRGTKQELGAVERQARHTGSGFRTTERDLGRMSRGAIAGSGAFRHLGRSVAFASGAFLGAAGFVSAVRHALHEAIDLNTQIARSQIVFGNHAKEVIAWSKTTEHSISLAGETSLKTANNFGTMLTAMGLAPGKAAALSKEMVKVAAAISLARGEADPAQAAQAISVALAGRGRALRQYGIILDESNLKAEALRLGLVKTSRDTGKVTIAQNALNIASARYADELKRHGRNSTQAASAYNSLLSAQAALRKETAGHALTLTNAQKAQAASNLVLRQGGRFTADYGRLLNTTAGRQRRFNEGVQNLREELGTAMLPVFNRVLDAINGYLSSLAEGGSRHKQFEHVVAAVGQRLRQMWAATRLVVRGLNSVANAIGGWKIAFELILAGLLAKKMLAFRSSVMASRAALILTGRAAVTAEGQIVAMGTAGSKSIEGTRAKAALLSGLLKNLAALGVITVVIELIIHRKAVGKAIGDAIAGAIGGDASSVAGGETPGDKGYIPPGQSGAARETRAAQRARAIRRQNPDYTRGQIAGELRREGYSAEEARYGSTRAVQDPAGPRAASRRNRAAAAGGGPASIAVAAARRPDASSVGFHLPGERTPYDCSAFTQAVFRKAGISIGSTTYTQQNDGHPVDRKSLQPGDLLFFTYPGERKPGHVGIYVGGGYMVHDHGASGGVAEQPVDWAHFNFARRVSKSGQVKGTDLGGTGGEPGATTGPLHVDHPDKKKKTKKPRFADPETIKIEDRRIREEEAAVRRARARGEITPEQAKRDLAKLEALRKALHKAHLTPREERDIADRNSRLWRNINKTIAAGVARARKHASELAKAHAKAVSDAEKAVNVARERLGKAWDSLAGRALEGFDRVTQANVDVITARFDDAEKQIQAFYAQLTPAEAALAALQARRASLTNERSLSDAQDQLALAQRLGDPQMIKEAMRAVQDAELDAQEAGLQAQADVERKAADDRAQAETDAMELRKQNELRDYEDLRQIQRDKLESFLDDLKTKLDEGTLTWKEALGEIKDYLGGSENLGDFGSLGALIGQTFTQGLLDALAGAGGAADAVDAALSKLRRLGYRWNPDTGDFEKIPIGALAPPGRGVTVPGAGSGGDVGGLHIAGAQSGGVVTRPTLTRIGEAYRREAILPLEDTRAMAAIRDALGGGGGLTLVVNVEGSVTSEYDLAQTIRKQLLRTQKANAGRLGFTGR